MEMDRIRKIRVSDTGTARYCRYMRMGLIDFMICSNGFECWRCDVDQRMEDRFGTHPALALKPAKNKQPFQVSGFTFYPEYLYSEGHVWAKPMDEHIRLGLDDLASILAMEAESAKFPSVGSPLKKKEVLVEISASGRKAKILSPLSGTVSTVNRDVEESPNLAWRDPYRRGWLIGLQPDRPKEVSELFSGPQAKEWFSKEAMNLATHLIKWAPNPFRKGELLKGPLIRKIIRGKWNQLKQIILAPKAD